MITFLTSAVIVAYLNTHQYCQERTGIVFTKNEKILVQEEAGIEIKIGESEFLKKERLERERLEEIERQKEEEKQKIIETKGKGSYAPGYCTWYVAKEKNIPAGWGDAKNWYAKAEQDGYEVGDEPRQGAIIVTRESRYGHTGIVEDVKGEIVTISEMNFTGRYRVSTRTVNIHQIPLVGFIY